VADPEGQQFVLKIHRFEKEEEEEEEEEERSVWVSNSFYIGSDEHLFEVWRRTEITSDTEKMLPGFIYLV